MDIKKISLNNTSYNIRDSRVTDNVVNGNAVWTSANSIAVTNAANGNVIKESGVSITTSLGSDNTTVPTSLAVKNAIDALPEPMIFKGSLGTGGTITSLPTASSSNTGFTYKVIEDGTYASQAAKVGDTFISDGSSWVLIPSGDEPSGTVTSIATGNGLTGGPITTSGTIYLLKATASELGGVKVGSGLSVTNDGTLSANSLTDNNFTTVYKNKLDSIATGAEVNVLANWNETNTSSDAYIQNKPYVAIQGADNDLVAHGNEINIVPSGYSGVVWINYRTCGDLNGNITEYILGNGAGVALGNIIHTGNIGSQSVNYATSAGSASSSSYIYRDAGLAAIWRTNESYRSGVYYSAPGNESVVFGNAATVTSWMFATVDPDTLADWTTLTPSLQIKNQCVAINKQIPNGYDGSYNLDVNGSANATTLYDNGERVLTASRGIERLAWWNNSVSHDVDDLRTGTTFAYTTHNAPVPGTILACASSGLSGESYTLLLLGGYIDNSLWFRNREGDNLVWHPWRLVIHSGNIGSQSVDYATSAGNADTVDGYHASAFVPKRESGASYNNVASRYSYRNYVAFWRIKIPKPDVWCMMQATFSINQDYNTGNYAKIIVYGVCHQTADWQNFSARVVGNGRDITVYGSDKQYIYIRTNCSYQTLTLDKLLFGDEIIDSDVSAVEIDWVDSLPSTYQTATMYQDIHSGNIGSQSVAYATSAGSAPASDVYAWAKASTKPSYSWSEITDKPFTGTTFVSGNSSNGDSDANNAVSNGHYYYTSNGPSTSLGASTDNGSLYVQSYSDNWVSQIAQDYRNGSLFVRGKNNGTWQPWKKIIDSDNIGLQNVNYATSADSAQTANSAQTARYADSAGSVAWGNVVDKPTIPVCTNVEMVGRAKIKSNAYTLGATTNIWFIIHILNPHVLDYDSHYDISIAAFLVRHNDALKYHSCVSGRYVCHFNPWYESGGTNGTRCTVKENTNQGQDVKIGYYNWSSGPYVGSEYGSLGIYIPFCIKNTSSTMYDVVIEATVSGIDANVTVARYSGEISDYSWNDDEDVSSYYNYD